MSEHDPPEAQIQPNGAEEDARLPIQLPSLIDEAAINWQLIRECTLLSDQQILAIAVHLLVEHFEAISHGQETVRRSTKTKRAVRRVKPFMGTFEKPFERYRE